MKGKLLVIGIVLFFLLFFVDESWMMRGLPHLSNLDATWSRLISRTVHVNTEQNSSVTRRTLIQNFFQKLWGALPQLAFSIL